MGIIAILASVLIPKVTVYVKEARKTQVIDQARKVILAVESVNMKSPNTIADDSNVEDAVEKSGGLLTNDDITKLNASKTNIATCKEIVDTEKYNFTLDDNNNLGDVKPIAQ
ncbi:pilin [Clostridium chauvoei]|uniref:Pilin n=2 Tax=Clostridium chauvoei TaxID=46867 RepID=A0ABD4RIM8_9CLOT|nr:pilin [Clostridium chauvoei]MBX7283376.1 pilin [Clostridium chauvoei]MBX7285941.1 pilin [Clostridium chauvoei]MBX7288380.1 pilin [Clostridium chauvoei]MBX7290995.1 pilin [Clostridium chauvoei]